MMEKISSEEAFKAMYLYLEKLYEMTGSDDLAGFLGGMSMLPDARPADPAIWEDWLDAIAKAKSDPDLDLDLKGS